jgi:hypothetical protein
MRPVKRTTTTAAVLTTALAVAATASASPAPAAAPAEGPSGNRVLSSSAGAPFQIALRKGTVYFADGGPGTINKITKKGSKVVVRVPGVSGVEFSRNGKTMAIAHGGGLDPANPARVTLVRGRHKVVANMTQYENAVNPDKTNTYGINASASTACKTEISAASEGAPATYTGALDSHPYQLARLRGGSFALADAGANAILRISRRGKISTVAVLPPQPITLSASQAAGLGAPSCAGQTYAFEPVPTDVERVGGHLMVTTLPGGPESPALGARGAVYRIKRGVVSKSASGFLGATNLGVAKGRVYVTELFGGKITKYGKGGRATRYNIANAVAVEATKKKLYIGTLGSGPTSPGKVIRLPR